jgi:hypothetical protein
MLSETISFDWGTNSPLPGFPADEFSVRWTGLLQAPASEAFTLFVEADDGVRLYIDDRLQIDAWFSPSSEVSSGSISLEDGTLHAIKIEYRDISGPARIRLSWSSSSIPKSIVPASSLYYERHLDGSPMTVEVTPGEVDSNTTYIEGPGLIKGDALDIFTFDVYAQDSHGNSQYNDGSDNWFVTVEGSEGWAKVGRINDVVTDNPTKYYPSELCGDCVTALTGNAMTLNLVNANTLKGQLIREMHFSVDTHAGSCSFVLSSINGINVGV